MRHLTPTYNSMISAYNGANSLCACVLGGARKPLGNRALHTYQKPLEGILGLFVSSLADTFKWLFCVPNNNKTNTKMN